MNRPQLRDGGRTLAWTLLLAVLSVVLCVTPLFDVLGYELGLALALPAALAGAHLAASRVWRARHRRAPSDAARAEAHPLATVATLYARSVAHIWALLTLPLSILLGNALRVRNCDLPGGVAWFVMLPMLSGALGAALGVCVALARPWRRRVTPTLLAAFAIVASLAWGVWRFYAAPPIFGFDPFLGYFAGTLYDEEVTITHAFLWARLYHVLAALFALSLAALFLDGETLSLRERAARGRAGLWLPAIALLFACGALHHKRAELGFQLDAPAIARMLGAEVRTPHFVLHYSPRGPYAKDLDLFASDAELRWQQLEALFGRAPQPPVHAYLFDSADDKRRLMGAAHTFIAKPWRREIYLQYEGWPQQVTWHELAHVFAGQFGDPLFGIARKGLHFNVGLIEGIAVAASWAGQPLTPHQQVKVLRDAGVVDGRALDEVMSPRFFGLNAGQAYALAGSFVRFLLDGYGVARLEQLFHEAGSEASYVKSYGKTFAELRDEWLAAVAAEPVPADEGKLALARLKRPSVFQKACAHALALRRQAAHATAQAGDRPRALAELTALCRDEPGDPGALAEALDAALAADARPQAQALATEMLRRHDPLLDGKAEMTLGDLALMQGDGGEARRHYARALAEPLDESTARLATVKARVAADPPSPERASLAQFLTQPPALHDPALDLMMLRALVDAHPARALYHYLLARQLLNKGRWREAADELSHPASEPLPDARFEREALRGRGQAELRLGEYDAARATFDELARDQDAGTGARLDAEDWRARVEHMQREAARPRRAADAAP